MSTIASRLGRLRAQFAAWNVDAVIVPSADPHQSEYTPERSQARAYMSGFTGSAGTVVVTADHAGLWTDSRYFVAAEAQLRNSEVSLHKSAITGAIEYPEWLARHLSAGSRVGIDPRLIPVAAQRSLASRLGRGGITLVALDDPMAEVWPDRPALPARPVWPLDSRYTGETAPDRIAQLRQAIADTGAASHVIATLDDIAWLLNLRGSDVPYNPVFLAYLTVTDTAVTLFTDESRLTSEARTALAEARVTVEPYQEFETALAGLPGPVLLDPERVSWRIAELLGNVDHREEPQPSTLMKARKNITELTHLRSAMVRDGQSMVRFLAWLDRRVEAHDPIDEAFAARKLQEIRSEDVRYISDSFDYISGWAGNGAIPHYRVDPATAAPFGSRGIYLIDSGAQYLDGTTDITRTIAVGVPTAEEREDFTLVLKGHIALARLQMPVGTAGRDIDVIARQPLWMRHRTYGHGTGHGVGFVLNVHEGPQKIAAGSSATPLEPGMIVSNEPGLYREGKHGIRIENLVAVQRAGGDSFGDFLSFETLTLCPIDLRLVDPALLTEAEREWLNEYHRVVREELSAGLDEADRAWLEQATRPLTAEG